jgi:hypothetical protein
MEINPSKRRENGVVGQEAIVPWYMVVTVAVDANIRGRNRI